MNTTDLRQSLALLSVALMPGFGVSFPGYLSGMSVSLFHFAFVAAVASGALALGRARQALILLPLIHLTILAGLTVISLLVWATVGGLKLSIAVSHFATFAFAAGLYLGASDIEPRRIAVALVAGLVPIVALDIGAFIFSSPMTSHSDWLRSGYGGIGINASFQNHGAGILLGLLGVYIATEYGAWKAVPARLIAETALFSVAVFSQSRSTIVAVVVTIFSYRALQFMARLAPQVFRPRNLIGLAIAISGALIAAVAALRTFRPDTADSRLHHFLGAFDLLFENPFGGSGAAWTAMNEKEPHNIIAQYAVQLGVPGVLLLVATAVFFTASLHLAAKERRPGFVDAIPACSLGIAIEAMLGPDIPFRGISFVVLLAVLFLGARPALAASSRQRREFVTVGAGIGELDVDVIVERQTY